MRVLRAAFPDNNADETNAIAKAECRANNDPMRPEAPGVSIIHAMAGTNIMANAIANMVYDIPLGSNRVIDAPAAPINNTPKYIMFAGSSPSMPPTAISSSA